jgi:hypothetical protein
MQYQGTRYTYGGVPSQGKGHWDCSSFINWVVGNDLGMAIPGYSAGTYKGQTHGPVVLDWATWSGATTIKGTPQPSDLTIWPGVGGSGHIGIVIGNNQMISALDTAQGTLVTPIQGYGPAGVSNIYRRVNGASGGGVSLPTGILTSAASSLPSGCFPGSTLIGMIFHVVASSRIRGRRGIRVYQHRGRNDLRG